MSMELEPMTSLVQSHLITFRLLLALRWVERWKSMVYYIDNTTTMGNINATGIVTANSAVSQNLTVGNDLQVTGN